MIVFDLKCAKGHVFEAWFSDSAAYERQAKRGAVACAICGDVKIEKALMAPNVAPSGKGKGAEARPTSLAATPSPEVEQVYKTLRAAREVVEKNFDNVGDTFADEARKIHYGETEKRNIYGDATPEDAHEMREEGIDFDLLPWLPPRNS